MPLFLMPPYAGAPAGSAQTLTPDERFVSGWFSRLAILFSLVGDPADLACRGAPMLRNVLLALLITTATVVLTKSFVDPQIQDIGDARMTFSGS